MGLLERHQQKKAILDDLALATQGQYAFEINERIARKKAVNYLIDFKDREIYSSFFVKKRAIDEFFSGKTRRRPSFLERRKIRKNLVSELLEIKQQIDPSPELLYGIVLAHRIARGVRIAYGKRMGAPYEKFHDYPRANDFSRDWSYPVDAEAENEITINIVEAQVNWQKYGFVTEEQAYRGMKPFEKCVLMIDPVDGSREAQMGAENATITLVGLPGNIENPTFADIQFGLTFAVKENLMYITQKVGDVVKVYVLGDGKVHEVLPFQKKFNPSLRQTRMVHEAYSMSSELNGIVIDPLMREIDFKTENPSGSYGLLSLIRAQHYLYVDLRKRLLEKFGHIPNLTTNPLVKAAMPMDIAAGWLMLKALGGKVTDAYGNDIDNFPLWSFDEQGRWSNVSQLSVVAAITPELHAKAMEKIEEGFSELHRRHPFPI